MNKKIAIIGSLCLTLAASLWRLAAQETPAARPQLFATVGHVPGIEQSWDGKYLHVMPYYNDEHPENSIPGSFWNVATRQKLLSSKQPVGFTGYNKVLDADKARFYCVRDLQHGRCTRLQNGKVRVYWPEHRFSPDGKRLTMELDGVIATWDTGSGKSLSRVRYAVGSTQINGAGPIGPTLSPDRTLMAAIERGDFHDLEFRLDIIDVQTGKVRFVLPERQYRWIGFSPDSRILETRIQRNYREGKNLSKTDKRYYWLVDDLKFWDAQTGKLLWARNGLQIFEYYSGRFTPDGKLYGAPQKKDFALLEARTGQLVRVLPGPISQGGAWTFSFDAKEIWAGDGEGRIWRWPIH